MRARARAWLKRQLTRLLTRPVGRYEQHCRNELDQMLACIRKGDVLLVEGDQLVSAVIKYLSQSSWSHAALYIGDELLTRGGPLRDEMLERFGEDAQHLVVEALIDGVVVSPLSKYVDYNVRLCRPHRLSPEHLKVVLEDAVGAIGLSYDVRNIVDLAVHLLKVSLVPRRERQQALRLGAGAATHVICTSLLGRFFDKVGFPVLPDVEYPEELGARGSVRGAKLPARRSRLLLALFRRPERVNGVYRRRDPTLLTPRDFDLSPYFEIVKFNVVMQRRFDYQRIEWADERDEAHE